MDSTKNTPEPGVVHAEPVLAVSDIAETLLYWHDVLGFPDTWHWGDPPVHGGASWHGTQIQFTRNPDLTARSEGHSVWIRARHVEQLYALHQTNRADIVSPLAQQPWGMGQYTVREINGYYIHFAAPMPSLQTPGEAVPHALRIIPRPPTAGELGRLSAAVGWSVNHSETSYEVMLSALMAGVVAENTETGDVVGCALLVGTPGNPYYVRDVIVHPAWQRQYVGTALMHALMQRADATLHNNTMLTLITNETLAPFYRQFNFTPAFSMIRSTRRGAAEETFD